MNNASRRVAVLMGGPSPEYEISLASGRHVIRRLSDAGVDVLPVEIDREGHWRAFDLKAYLPLTEGQPQGTAGPPLPQPIAEGIEAVLCRKPPIDVAFLALHGPYGEDGTVQAILEAFRVRYTGSSVLASALAISKSVSKVLFDASEVITPEWQEVRLSNWDPENTEEIIDILDLPLVVKPDNQGSSIGIRLAGNRKELIEAIESCFAYSPVVVVEEFLKGTELTVPVVGDALREPVTALAVTEIRHSGEFFDFQAKYNDPNTQEITPAQVPDPVMLVARQMAMRAHYVLGCAGITRTDMIWVPTREIEGGLPYVAVLEVNTIPGFTPVSIIPRAVHATGGDFTDLLLRLLEETLPHDEEETAYA